jgi:hypothetical protein
VILKFFQDFGKKSTLFWLGLLCICSSYTLASLEEEFLEEESDAQEYVKNKSIFFVEQIVKELDLDLRGHGTTGSQDIEKVELSFSAYRPATVEEARLLNVFLTEKFLKYINEDEQIRPYLREYPFPAERVCIEITFRSKFNHRPFANDSVDHVYHASNLALFPNTDQLIYYADNAFTGSYITLLKEPYEEAERIVRDSGLTELLPHETTQLEIAMDEVFAVFINNMWKDCQLSLRSIGGKMPGNVEEVEATFEADYSVNREQARELMVYAAQNLVGLINANEKLKPYLKEGTFLSNQIKMRFLFKIKDYDHYRDEELGCVILSEDNISYLRECNWFDEGREIELFNRYWVSIGEDSYSEAMQFAKGIDGLLPQLKPEPTFIKKVINYFTQRIKYSELMVQGEELNRYGRPF